MLAPVKWQRRWLPSQRERLAGISAAQTPAHGRTAAELMSATGHTRWQPGIERHLIVSLGRSGDMATRTRDDLEGIILEVLGQGSFRVQLENGVIAVAYAAGKTRKRLKGAMTGDRLAVQVTSDDGTRGRVAGRASVAMSDD